MIKRSELAWGFFLFVVGAALLTLSAGLQP
jgi:hypothetical protein